MRLLVAVFMVLPPNPARAADKSVEAITAGLAAFEALDYERAVELLQEAYTDSLSREDRVTVLRTLAFSHVALGEADPARAEFRLLLRIDPATALDPTISPRARLLFEEARAEIVAQAPSPAPVAAPSPRPRPLVAIAPPPPPPKIPLYKRGWLWGALAGTSVAAIVIGAVAGALAPPDAHITIAHP